MSSSKQATLPPSVQLHHQSRHLSLVTRGQLIVILITIVIIIITTIIILIVVIDMIILIPLIDLLPEAG